MASDDAAGEASRPYVRFSGAVAREILRRTAAGETQAEICAGPGMPCPLTLYRWVRRRGAFGRAYGVARAMAGGVVDSRSSFCAETANEIVARVSEGEMLASICADPRLPSLRTICRWRAAHPEFGEALSVGREALAERLADVGWKMALEATPQTAHLTRVRLGHLRWMAAVLGPRTHGRMKAVEPPEPPEVTTICYRHFDVEEDTATGRHRVVSWTPDPKTLLPVRTHEGEWRDPVDPAAKAAGLRMRLYDRRGGQAPAPSGPKPDDPEGWC